MTFVMSVRRQRRVSGSRNQIERPRTLRHALELVWLVAVLLHMVGETYAYGTIGRREYTPLKEGRKEGRVPASSLARRMSHLLSSKTNVAPCISLLEQIVFQSFSESIWMAW